MRPGTPTLPNSLARLGVVFYLLESVLSVWGQLLTIGGVVVSGDAAATANNVQANETAFRLAIAASLLAVVFHLVVAVLFYELFKPVDRRIALLAVLFLVVACAIQAFAALLPVGALLVLAGTRAFGAFTVEQLQALALMLLSWNAQAYNTYLVFFGSWCIAIGYLVFRSTFLPRILGVGMALAGLGYTVYLYRPLAQAVTPYNLALGVGELALLLWLVFRGVNAERWTRLAEKLP
jgi:hypothetical protein